jgi:hypothetical protein
MKTVQMVPFLEAAAKGYPVICHVDTEEESTGIVLPFL